MDALSFDLCLFPLMHCCCPLLVKATKSATSLIDGLEEDAESEGRGGNPGLTGLHW